MDILKWPAGFGVLLAALVWTTPLLAQSKWRDSVHPLENNDNPGSYFEIHQAVLSLSPRELVLRALDENCTIDPPAGKTPCDEATMFVITDAIVKIAAQQHRDPIPGRIFLPNLPDSDDYVEEAMDGLSRELENFLGGGDGNDFGYPSAIEGTVLTPCGPMAYSFSTNVGYSSARDSNGELTDYPELELIVRIGIEGTCDCQEINGEQIRDIRYGYQGALELGFHAIDQIEWSPGYALCRNTSSCDCPVPELGDAFPGSETYVLHFDSPLWCTYGGGSIPFYPPGFTPPLPSSPLPGLGSPMPAPGQSLPPVPGADGGAPGDTPGLPPAPGVPVAGEPGVPGQPGQPSAPGVPAIPVPPEEEPDPSAPTPPTPPTVPTPPTTPPEETPPAPLVPVPVKATRSALASGAFVPGSGALATFNTPDPALAKTSDDGFAEGENSFQLDSQGEGTAMVPQWIATLLAGAPLEFIVDPSQGFVLHFAGNVDPMQVLDPALLPYVSNVISLGGNTFISLLMSEHLVAGLQAAMNATGALSVEPDVCVDPKPLADPYFSSAGSWSQTYPDQWAIQRVGFTADASSAWDVLKPSGEPVVVAVIDSGLDWNHREIPWASLWQNPGEIRDNGIDDDGNGYIDDLIGWDFWDGDNKPWDVDGHGTFVAGILFADASNGEGIVGITRNARLMVLKAMNAFGHSRASSVAKAIIYAADNGARVINLSLGGPGESTVVREAIDYAFSKNAVVVVAAGNEATPTENQSVAGLPNAITVAATNTQDRRSLYSNYGAGIDIAAPGDDVLSLRARRTDLLKNIPDVDYEAELAFVGEDRRYYRASGTSFATPIVTGVASLVLAERPELTAAQVKRILKQTAEDIETPGVDHFTGYGLVDAKAALSGDPGFHIDAEIAGVAVVENKGKQALEVRGTAIADAFKNAVVYIGSGSDPTSWQEVARVRRPVTGDILGVIPASSFAGSSSWYIRLVVTHRTDRQREYWFKLDLG